MSTRTQIADPGETPESIFAEVADHVSQSRFLDAYRLAIVAGPLDSWQGAEEKMLAARLAGHLGSAKLRWRLIREACREKPATIRFQFQRAYCALERHGVLAAWELARKLRKLEGPNEEKADIIALEALCNTVFRDFEQAAKLYAEARNLAPASPWIWTESSAEPGERGAFAEAIERLDRALQLAPFYRPAIQRKAAYLQSLQRDDEARALLEQTREHLQSGAIVNQLIVLYSEQEQWSRILELLNEAEALSPLADENVRSWFYARRTDASLGLEQRVEAATCARLVTNKPFYVALAERLEKPSLQHRRAKLDVPFVQQNFNTCAPATLSALTAFWGNLIPQDTIIGEICYDGTYDFVERRWAEQAGWYAREFRVTWEVAISLLDRRIPFILTTQGIDMGHSQAIIGYDTVRQTLLLRDPSFRHYNESDYQEFEKHHRATGPRGLLILPSEAKDRISGIDLPEAELYDELYRVNCALRDHDRGKAERLLQGLNRAASHHRITWLARSALAHYDQNPVAHLQAIDGLLSLFPDDDRLLYVRLQLLSMVGRNHETTALLKARCRRQLTPAPFVRSYGQQLKTEPGKTQLATRFVRKALKQNPRDIEGLSLLAEIYWNLPSRDLAIAVERLAASVGEKKEATANRYFEMLASAGMIEAGLEFLERRFQTLSHQSGEPGITLVDALGRLNRISEVNRVLEDAIARRPDDSLLQIKRAQVERSAGRFVESRLALEKAKHGPPIPWLRAAAQLEKLLGGFDQALSYWQQLSAISPLHMEAHREIAWLLARRDGKSAAKSYLTALGSQFPHHRGLLELEISWQNDDSPENAEQRLTDYLREVPMDAWALRELSLILAQRNALSEALQPAAEAKRLEPASPASWEVEGLLLDKAGQNSEARDRYRHTLELDIDRPYALRRLVACSDGIDLKLASLRFIREQLRTQPFIGAGIDVYREVAFPILLSDELTEHLQEIWRPNIWESWTALASHLLSVGKIEESREMAEKATQRFPTLPEVWRVAATVHQYTEDWPKVESCFRQALLFAPDLQPAICGLADTLRRLDRTREARELLESSLRRNPFAVQVLWSCADLLWHSGERDQALAQLKTAIEIDPHDDNAWLNLEHWSQLTGQSGLAFDLAKERATRLATDDGAWLKVAKLAQQSNRGKDALEAALLAREHGPRNPRCHEAVVVALAEQQRFDEARTACQPIIFGHQFPAILRARQAWILAQEGAVTHAIDEMLGVLSHEPDLVFGWQQIIQWCLSTAKLDLLLEGTEKLVRLAPLDPRSYGNRAFALSRLARETEAKADYRRALIIDPGYQFAVWQLFSLEIKAKAFQDASRTLLRARSHLPLSVLLPAQALVAARQGLWQDATKLIRRAVVLSELDESALRGAFEVFDETGKQNDLIKVLRYHSADPKLNPIVGRIWVERDHFVTFNPLAALKGIPPESQALPAILQAVINQLRGEQNRSTLKRVVARYRNVIGQNTLLWGSVGVVLCNYRRWQEAIDWLQDWEGRPGIQGWVVTNYVFALHALGRITEADAASKTLLERGLADHTRGYHLLYLALSALERSETREAERLIGDCRLVGAQALDQYFQVLVQQALVIQSNGNKQEIARSALVALRAARPLKLRVKRILNAETRALTQMRRDNGSLSLRAFLARKRLGDVSPRHLLWIVFASYWIMKACEVQPHATPIRPIIEDNQTAPFERLPERPSISVAPILPHASPLSENRKE